MCFTMDVAKQFAQPTAPNTVGSVRDTLDHMLRETGRVAILRRELAPHGPAWAVDRVLRESRANGTLTRVGRGIYGIGGAKVFEIVPEVMPKLGYTILPSAPVRGYSQKSGGAVWRLDRPCRRRIRKRGVQAMFETPNGRLVRPTDRKHNMSQRPTRTEVDDHYHAFEYCHSPARAEKDLLVRQALATLERFRSDRATLAIEGGTALVVYHRLTSRFSEDLDVRLIPSDAVCALPSDQKLTAVKEIGQEFKQHMVREMPYLRPTRKGRIRKDGVLQTFIYDYDSLVPDDQVVAGIKCEMAHVPLLLPTTERVGVSGGAFAAIRPLEIVSGKWQALTGRLPERQDSYPDLVRHVHDIALLQPVVESMDRSAAKSAVMRGETTPGHVAAVCEELRRPVWKDHYENYINRLGMHSVSEIPNCHPPWQTIRTMFATMVRELDMVGAEDMSTVGALAKRASSR